LATASACSPRRRISPPSRNFFGDSIRDTAEINFGSVGLGMTLGVILGLIPISLPGGTALRLGLAGGPLVVGLILAHREHTGPFTWVIPFSANLALRQIGLVLFQSGVGTRAGFGFVETVRTSGVEMILAGGLITADVALASLFVGHRLLKRPFESVLGLTCAIHTEPASLAFASHRSPVPTPHKLRTRKFSRCARSPRLSLRSCWWRGDWRAKGKRVIRTGAQSRAGWLPSRPASGLARRAC